MHYDFSHRDYRGAVIPVTERRKVNVQSLMLSAEWQPLLTVTVTGALRHEMRNSSLNEPMILAATQSIKLIQLLSMPSYCSNSPKLVGKLTSLVF
jgi:hypothetical protein